MGQSIGVMRHSRAGFSTTEDVSGRHFSPTNIRIYNKHADLLTRSLSVMSRKRTSKRSFSDVPYDPRNRDEVMKFWAGGIKHRGIEEFRRKRGRPPLAQRKIAISLRLDPEVLAEWK